MATRRPSPELPRRAIEKLRRYTMAMQMDVEDLDLLAKKSETFDGNVGEIGALNARMKRADAQYSADRRAHFVTERAMLDETHEFIFSAIEYEIDLFEQILEELKGIREDK